ncbi:MAG: TAXI family TRAP transporter solute-binding subunit [Halorhodospira halophila]|uniref:TAXI family TRAP transporter solute-binding subunit n=1 Tax=Halorhodospira halophila TaxID=1053 RepID=UPI0026E91D24|nr:TAXI family TRAP transporter solute-binding subunit [Halorhodospira halophila]MCC3751304.1 TAXI family TRAP transporter solute-binding subunit [Halorhodospira halophila]
MRMKTWQLAICATSALALSAPALADRDDWPRSFTVGTASQGGTYYIYGSGWADMVAGMLDIRAGGEVTGGPVQNATLVETGDHEFGLVTMGPARAAWDGESELAPGMEHRNIRAVFPMYQTTFHIITREGDELTSMEDLEGKRVGVGPSGGTADMYFPQFFDELGIDVRVRNGGASDLAGQLQDGLIDAFAFAAGTPISAFSQLEAEINANIFSVTEAQQEQLLEAFPALSPADIEADLYSSLDADIPAISIWNFAITHQDMPESLVYEVTRAVMENHDRMMDIHRASRETLPENHQYNDWMPWHPGAVRWFEENGYEIPEDLRG